LNAMQRYGRSRINPNVPDVNTDWYKEILRPAGIQNHSISVEGGNQSASYSIGTNYFAQEGILDMKNEYERFNLRTKLDFKATDWFTIGGNMILSNALKYGEEAGAWNQAYFAVPILPVYDPNLEGIAEPVNYANAQDLGYRSGQNPFPTLRYSDNRLKIRKLMANFYAKLQLIPEKLDFKTTYNHAFTSLDERNVRLPYFIGNSFQRVDASINKSTGIYSDQIWDNILTYTDRFDLHNITVMAGTSFRDEAYSGLRGGGLNFPWQREESWYIDQSQEKPEGSVGDGGARQYGLSYFGRLSYNYNDRYLLYATMRADGSSKYQQKWGYFPTVGIGWVLSEEPFLKNHATINFLKLRASWGQLGNDKIQASDGAITTSPVNLVIDDVMVWAPETITSSMTRLTGEVVMAP
ncbi:MAG TPA: TonB-dependent receptor, partial [Prolixibacteraceae bacterium]|nr:TonB-dependent receptor [Prolixibacteraceae bacterium]